MSFLTKRDLLKKRRHCLCLGTDISDKMKQTMFCSKRCSKSESRRKSVENAEAVAES
jgi:hypothetical protein